MPFDGTEINDSLLRVLEDARALLARPGGWVQHMMVAYWNPEPSYCLIGARRGNEVSARAYARALGFNGYGNLTRWNDADKRTQAEVVARLDAAIERRRAEVLERVS